MKPATALTVCLAAVTPVVSAWPKWLPDMDSLVVRQDSESSAEPSATPTPTRGAKPSASASEEDDKKTAEAEPSNTSKTEDDEEKSSATTTGRKQTDLNTAKVPSGSDKKSKPTQTEFDITDPVGGVVMLTPAPMDPALKLYKIGDEVIFGWNYTNLLATPTAIDIIISVATKAVSWTLTQNMTWKEEGSFTWDSSEQATAVQSPLLTEEYTLVIYDADSEISATPRPGYLGVFESFTFDMYQPREYKPLSEWKCPTCSGAAPKVDSKVLSFALTMSVVTVASFTWFVTGFSL